MYSRVALQSILYLHKKWLNNEAGGVCADLRFADLENAIGHVEQHAITLESTITNEAGGSQSKVPYAFHLVPYDAILAVARVLDEGSKKYGIDNWKKIPIEEHANHNIGHTYRQLSGNRDEEHLVNAACRALFALQLSIEAECAK